MSKGLDARKNLKKAPQKTLKERQNEKREKRQLEKEATLIRGLILIGCH